MQGRVRRATLRIICAPRLRERPRNERQRNPKRLILGGSRMHRPSVWITTRLRPRIVGHFPVHGMPDIGGVISFRAGLWETGQVLRVIGD
jgi:hypothetical protein